MLSSSLLFLFFGCFLQSAISTTPGVSTDPNDVGFYLYPNQDDASDTDFLVYNDVTSITESRYNPSKNLILYTSGLMQSYLTDQAITNAYLQAGFAKTANIIVVDWGALSGNRANPSFFNITELALLGVLPLYIDAFKNVPIVGQRVQQFISFLNTTGNLPGGPGSVHLVGQSLGAHVMGVAGGQLRTAGFFLGRITGTEPAGILYQAAGLPLLSANERLDISDANRVEIVHTNQGEVGWLGSLGHVDFFVNGGGPLPQPTCAESVLTNIFCSHNLAVKYFANSILDTSRSLRASCCYLLNFFQCGLPASLFGGFRCFFSTAQFGEYVSPSSTGNYYININA